jgi:hypothetical protein
MAGKSSALGCMNQQIVEGIGTLFLVLVGNFLALDAVGRPRDSVQPLDTNILFAMGADSESAFVDAVQGRTDVSKHVGLPVQISDRQFAFGCILDLVQGIRALLDRDSFTVSQHMCKLGLFGLQDLFEFVSLGLRHRFNSLSCFGVLLVHHD